MAFKYELGSTVSMKFSNEFGQVIARAEYDNSEDSYLVRYKAGDERQVEAWWCESAITN